MQVKLKQQNLKSLNGNKIESEMEEFNYPVENIFSPLKHKS